MEPNRILYLLAGLLLGWILASCGNLRASPNYSARRFIGGDGSTCYAILNQAGDAVGGNCVPGSGL